MFLFNAVLANFFLLMILTYLFVDKASAGIYDFQISFRSANSTSVLLGAKKDILKTISILVSATRKVS